MDIGIKNILQSAERILDSRTDSQKQVSQNQVPASAGPDFTLSLGTKYIAIQSRLSELQSSLSKEQAKISILEEGNHSISELATFRFGDEKLFGDLIPDTPQSQLLEQAKESLDALVKRIREKQVESENLFSLGTNSNADSFQEVLKSLSLTSGISKINEKSVQKLLG